MYALILEAVGMYGRELYQLLPAFILGVGLAATIKTFKWDLKLRAYMRDSGAATIPLAVFLGLFSPLCACGVLPIVIPLAVSGCPPAAIAGPARHLSAHEPRRVDHHLGRLGACSGVDQDHQRRWHGFSGGRRNICP